MTSTDYKSVLVNVCHGPRPDTAQVSKPVPFGTSTGRTQNGSFRVAEVRYERFAMLAQADLASL